MTLGILTKVKVQTISVCAEKVNDLKRDLLVRSFHQYIFFAESRRSGRWRRRRCRDLCIRDGPSFRQHLPVLY